MAEDDLSDVVGGPEEMGFKLTFERKEGYLMHSFCRRRRLTQNHTFK